MKASNLLVVVVPSSHAAQAIQAAHNPDII